MNEIEAFVEADRTLAGIVAQIGDDDWDVALPEGFPTNGDRDYTLREILAYQAYDEAWIPTMIAGNTIAEIGADRFGDPIDNALLGDTPAANYRKLVDQGVAAVQALDESDLDRRTVHYSYGDYSAREALWHAIVFRTGRAVDVARAIGIPYDLPGDLVTATWDIVEPNAEEWRRIGVFGPRVDVAADAPLQDRLLGLTGRQP